MLETVRQYAREKLLEVSGGEITRARHLAYFVRVAEQAEPELYRSDQLQWFNRLEDELDNFRLALEWGLDTDVESGLRIATIPWRFWQSRGYLREIGNLTQMLERYPAVTHYTPGLSVTSLSVFRQGDFPEAIRIAGESLQMARTLSDRGLEAFSLSCLGAFTLLQGNRVEGIVFLEQSLALSRLLGDKIGQANAMEWLSVPHSDLERALFYAGESQKLYRELGDLTDMANGLCTLAILTMWSGDFSSPVPWLEEARSIARQLGDQIVEAYALSVQGRLAHWRGEYAQAHACYEEAIALNEKTGYHYVTLWVHANMAYAFLEQGEVQRARGMFAESIRGMQNADLIIGLVYAIEGVASLHVNQGGTERAVRLFAWADAMREKIADPRPPVEQACVERDLEVIHSRLNDADVSRLCAEGQKMTDDEAVALALKE
jgi:tetratricopeptide (TPR) repeat protein